MDHERWKNIEEIFHGALELNGIGRSSFLDSSCSGDGSLRIEVETLLAETDADLPFLDEPLFSMGLSVLADHQPKDLSGQRLSQYKLVKRIGRGGMGEVYLADDLRLHRRVAIKLLPTYETEAVSLDRFRHEARLASSISHSNIAHIYGIGRSRKQMFIAMEFVEGKTLREHMGVGRLTLRGAIDIATQVGLALKAAHDRGVVHRDIKPENIIVRPDGVVKVVDFGVAKMTEPRAYEVERKSSNNFQNSDELFPVQTESDLLIGTANYMSPELVRGRNIDTRTDIWSLGVVLYELVVGERPFSGSTYGETVVEILTKDITLDRSRFPERLCDIVARSICKDRELRYASTSEIIAELCQLRSESDRVGLSELEVPIGPSDMAVRRPGVNVLGENSWALFAQSRKLWAALLLVTVMIVGWLSWYKYIGDPVGKQILSIAVLPFVIDGDNAEIDYISDGLTDSLMRSLSQLPNLSVKARPSISAYKGLESSVRKIGEELDVQSVLRGKMLQRGNDVTLSVFLIDAKTESILWSVQYHRKQSELSALQREIAGELTRYLRVSLSDQESQRISKSYTTDPVAYKNYQLGRFHWNKRTGDDLKRSVEYYDAAIAIDPDFALAYAGLADSYVLFPSFIGAQPKDAFPKAEAAAKKALELDGSLAEAHAALAFAYFNFEWKFKESDEHIRTAIALNPNYSTAYHWYGNSILLAEGRLDESIDALETAHDLDPLSVIISADLATSYMYALRLDEAIEHYVETLMMDNSFQYAHLNLGRAYLLRGDLERSLDELQRASGSQLDPKIPMLRSRVYSKMGRRADALRMFDEIKEMQRVRYVSNYTFAVVYTGLGDVDLAFASLENAFKAHDDTLIYLKTDPLLAELRGDPRFIDILARIGIPR